MRPALHLFHGPPPPTIQAGPRNRQGITGWCYAHVAGELFCGLYQPLSSSSRWFRGIPRSSEAFFWISSMTSARCKRFFNRAFSRSSSLTRGSSCFALGPRFCLARPSLAILSRCRRQLLRLEEKRPSRLRIAPTSPGILHWSTSRRMRSLYAAVNRRRLAFSETAGSGTESATLVAGAPVALRAPSAPATPSNTLRDFKIQSFSPFYTKLRMETVSLL